MEMIYEILMGSTVPGAKRPVSLILCGRLTKSALFQPIKSLAWQCVGPLHEGLLANTCSTRKDPSNGSKQKIWKRNFQPSSCSSNQHQVMNIFSPISKINTSSCSSYSIHKQSINDSSREQQACANRRKNKSTSRL